MCIQRLSLLARRTGIEWAGFDAVPPALVYHGSHQDQASQASQRLSRNNKTGSPVVLAGGMTATPVGETTLRDVRAATAAVLGAAWAGASAVSLPEFGV
jgi:hypothetical protein